MGESRCPGSLGIGRLTLSKDFIPARTPGTLGRLDAADPDAWACPGDTPGSLGLRDHGEPAVRLVLPLIWQYADDYVGLEDRVLDKQLELAKLFDRSGSRRKQPLPPAPSIPDSELQLVENDQRLRKEVAEKCKKLLHEARADLAKEKAEFLKKPKEKQEALERDAKAKGGVPVTKVHSIGISSGYRSFEHDRELWHKYYPQYYSANYEALWQISRSHGGPHGSKAVQMLVRYIRKRKAAPGYSNHTNGIAVDFFTKEGHELLVAKTGNDKQLKQHNQRWEKSWFYKWLDAHKKDYGIERIPSEAWHWEFQRSIPADAPKTIPQAAKGASQSRT